MTLKLVTTTEKLQEIESIILHERNNSHRDYVLKAIASDLRARLNSAPSVTLIELENRMVAVARGKTANGYAVGVLAQLGEYMVGRYPIMKQALELFGAQVETAAQAEGQKRSA